MQLTGPQIWIKNADLLLLLVWTWCYASFSISGLTQPDQGTFAAFGYHLLQGKTLYIDFFDHKPPAICLLNAAYMAIGGVSENTIGWFVLGFGLVQVIVFYRLLQALGLSRLAVFGFSLCFITAFFRFKLFGTGNFTEQYGVLCTSAALLFYLKFLKSNRYEHLLGSALLWGLAFSFKEPFLFSAFPAIIWLWFHNQNRLKSYGIFFIGFALPLLIQLWWLWQSGAWSGYYHHLRHSLQYTAHGDPIWVKIIKYYGYYFGWFSLNYKTALILYILAIPGIWLTGASRSILFLLLGQQFCDYIGTSLSGNGWHHYYLQSTPLMVVVMCWGISGYFRWFKGKLWGDKPALSALLIVVLMFCQIKPWLYLAKSPEKQWYDEIERYLNRENVKRPISLTSATEEFGFYYVRLQGLSPMRYIVPYPYHWVITNEISKKAFLKAEYERFKKQPPDYIVTGNEYSQAWVDAGIDSLAMEGYKKVVESTLPGGKQVLLLKRK